MYARPAGQLQNASIVGSQGAGSPHAFAGNPYVQRPVVPVPAAVGLAIAALATLLLGILPGRALSLAQAASAQTHADTCATQPGTCEATASDQPTRPLARSKQPQARRLPRLSKYPVIDPPERGPYPVVIPRPELSAADVILSKANGPLLYPGDTSRTAHHMLCCSEAQPG